VWAPESRCPLARKTDYVPTLVQPHKTYRLKHSKKEGTVVARCVGLNGGFANFQLISGKLQGSSHAYDTPGEFMALEIGSLRAVEEVRG
jgi:hypothetical protein